MKVWMKVSKDKYELPEVVANSSRELARMLGVPRGSIVSAVSMSKKRGNKSQYVSVEVDED